MQADPSHIQIHTSMGRLSLEAPGFQQCHVKFSCWEEVGDEGEVEATYVGELRYVITDSEISLGRGALDVADEDSAEALGLAQAVFDPDTGWIKDSLDLEDPVGCRALLLETMELEPQWRRQGLGPLLLGLAIEHVIGGCTVAVGEPWPIDQDKPLDGKTRTQAVAGLRKTWRKLGMRRIGRTNYYYLDPRQFPDTMRQLREHHGLD